MMAKNALIKKRIGEKGCKIRAFALCWDLPMDDLNHRLKLPISIYAKCFAYEEALKGKKYDSYSKVKSDKSLNESI